MANSTTPLDYGAVEAARHGIQRSKEWPRVEREHLKNHSHCTACKSGTDSQAKLQVHHIFPFHYCVALGRPDLELDDRNLITLCEAEAGHPAENHHLLIGHLDDFKSSNLDVVADALTTFHGKRAADIRINPHWKQKEAARLKPLDEMTAKDKREFLAKMNARFPKK